MPHGMAAAHLERQRDHGRRCILVVAMAPVTGVGSSWPSGLRGTMSACVRRSVGVMTLLLVYGKRSVLSITRWKKSRSLDTGRSVSGVMVRDSL